MQNAVLLPLVVLLLALTSGCGVENSGDSDSLAAPSPSVSPTASDSVPAEFRAACGKPGAEVVTERLRVVIKHADCDLTGVTILNQGRGVAVPSPGTGVSNSSGVDVQVDKDTQDVTFTAEAEVAQY